MKPLANVALCFVIPFTLTASVFTSTGSLGAGRQARKLPPVRFLHPPSHL